MILANTRARLGREDAQLVVRLLSRGSGRAQDDAEAKLAALREEAASLGLTPLDAMTVGDGANDLDMIKACGLGVAYRAKPVVAAQAHARCDHADLTALLYFQGYRDADFAS